MQWSTAVRTAKQAAIETNIGVSAILRLYSGAVPANPAAGIGAAVLLVEMLLPADWASQAAGVTSKVGTWSGVAVASGTPTFFRIWDTAGTTCGGQGTAGVGSGEANSNGTITSGQTVTVSSTTITDNNA